jgi:hypothetical protein
MTSPTIDSDLSRCINPGRKLGNAIEPVTFPDHDADATGAELAFFSDLSANSFGAIAFRTVIAIALNDSSLISTA